MKRILITGANGQLGRDIQVELSRRNLEFFAASRSDVDIFDINACDKVARSFKPDAIINCAAYTDVDGAEANKQTCYQVNSIGPYHLGCLSLVHNIPLLHISTDYVFSGDQKVPYTTEDPTSPINVYGYSKRDSERLLRHVEKKYIVRLSSVFGRSKINFVNKIIDRAQTQRRVEVVADQTALITYTADIAPALVDILWSGAYGLYHLGNVGAVSRYDWAKFIVKEAGIKCDVVPISSSVFNFPAKRPCYSVLDISGTMELLKRSVPDWQDATRRFVQQLRGADSRGQLEGVYKE